MEYRNKIFVTLINSIISKFLKINSRLYLQILISI